MSKEETKLPVDEWCQAIRGLIQNALDAGPGDVEFAISSSRTGSRWKIKDSGSGMSTDILQRVSEPFFTTKQPGKGMGLGLFLAENVVGRLGGNIQIDSSPGIGTTVVVELPKEPINLMESLETGNEKNQSLQ